MAKQAQITAEEEIPQDCEFQVQSSPEEKAGLISRVLFLWVSDIFCTSKQKKKENDGLEQDDLWALTECDTTQYLCDQFAQAWNEANGEAERTSRAAFTKALWTLIRATMVRAGLLKFISSSLQISQSLFIHQILVCISNIGTPSYDQRNSYLWLLGFASVLVLGAFFENSFAYNASRAGWQTRSVITAQVYQKSMRLIAYERKKMSVGRIVNLMQIDSSKIENFLSSSAHALWDSIYQITAYSVILYAYLGAPAFVGVAVMALILPVQTLMFQCAGKSCAKMAEDTDSRLKLTNEALLNILAVKMAAWEENLKAAIREERNRELSELWKIAFLKAAGIATGLSVPTLGTLATLTVYAFVQNGQMNAAASIFTALTIFAQLKVPFVVLPSALSQLAQARISRDRITDFLDMDEVQQNQRENHNTSAIQVSHASFFWGRPVDDSEDSTSVFVQPCKTNIIMPVDDKDVEEFGGQSRCPALEDITLSIEKGTLTAIIGSVGSGKTSLVHAMLGELAPANGKVNIFGSIAFASQKSCIFQNTLRENILFGEPMNEKRYSTVLRVCQLERDLDNLPNGDLTYIGERGINLSGGQKQRISLARAVYSSKDIVILDDPLSALDPEVANLVFEECIVRFLGTRTCILVTNQLNLLPKCDHIITMERTKAGICKVSESGSYSTLLSSGLNFSKTMKTFFGSKCGEGEVTCAKNHDSDNHSEDTSSGTHVATNGGDQLIQREERYRGAVHNSVYAQYLKAGGGYTLAFVLLFFCGFSQVAGVLSIAWVAIWTNDIDYQQFSFQTYMIGYGCIAFLVVSSDLLRNIGISKFGLNASKHLHDQLLERALHAPMSFFDTTPLGRVISRFSKDLYLVDTRVPASGTYFLFVAFSLLFSILTVSYTNPIFLVSLPTIGVFYWFMMQKYLPIARDSKRLESISRSPIFAHFSESIEELSTIRSFQKTTMFCIKNAEYIDENLRGWFLSKVAERWLAIRLELLGAFITSLAAVLALITAERGGMSTSVAGLVLTFSLSITSYLGLTVRNFADFESNFTSVERVLHYASNIPQEPVQESVIPPASWPEKGQFLIQDLKLKYRENSPFVLSGVSLDIGAGQKIGICGRTGSGKSSLLLAFMRIVEPELQNGKRGPIVLDGLDISRISLHELRSKISIVPQSPTLFSGTLRQSLDPFNKHTDAEIWAALAKCEMKQAVQERGGLESKLGESGDDCSQGQKQLLCLARSILKNSRVILLDEATSALDPETDEAIQRAIRNCFSDCTVITIAHRINTILDSDKIVVMSRGKFAEAGAPQDLLLQKESMFSNMVDELGPEKASCIRKFAAEKKRSTCM